MPSHIPLLTHLRVYVTEESNAETCYRRNSFPPIHVHVEDGVEHISPFVMGFMKIVVKRNG